MNVGATDAVDAPDEVAELARRIGRLSVRGRQGQREAALTAGRGAGRRAATDAADGA